MKRLSVFAALWRKESSAFFDTAAAYVAAVVLLLTLGYLFASPLFLQGQATLASFADSAPLLFLFFIPALTMRLYAEEFKSGTMELLATLPVHDVDVLAAKYLAALTVVAFTLGGTALYPLTLGVLGRPDWGGVAGAYAGLFLTASLLAAAGLWASTLSRSQAVAFLTAFLAGFALFLLGKISFLLPPALGPLAEFLGLDSHLATLARGVLDTRDLLYYGSGILFFLFAAYARVARSPLGPGQARPAAAVGLCLMAGCLVLANLLARRLYLRLDLSEGGAYSLSPGSRRLLRELDGPIEVRAYFSRELPPELGAVRAYLEDLLQEYRDASGGRLSFRFTDPDSTEGGKEEALRQGVAPLQFNVVSREKFELREGFLGLVLQREDKREVLPVVSKAEGLEHDLTSAVLRLTRAGRKAVGLVSSHGALPPARLEARLREELGRNYDLRPVDLASLPPGGVPRDLAGLLLLGPEQRLGEEALYALDQFLLSGKPLAVALDTRRADTANFTSSRVETGLEGWLKGHGVRVRQNYVLDEQSQKVTLSQRSGWLMLSTIADYPLFVVATDLDREHPLTRHLSALTLPLVSPVETQSGDARARVLARSSPHSWLRTAWVKSEVHTIHPLPRLVREASDAKGPFPLAVELSGAFRSSRPLPKGASATAHLDRSSAPGRLLVLGTSRFARPELPAPEGGALLLNIVDWMALDPDLTLIRSKGSAFRPLMEVSPPSKSLLKWLNVLGPPCLAVLFGLVRLRLRRRALALRVERYRPRPAGRDRERPEHESAPA